MKIRKVSPDEAATWELRETRMTIQRAARMLGETADWIPIYQTLGFLPRPLTAASVLAARRQQMRGSWPPVLNDLRRLFLTPTSGQWHHIPWPEGDQPVAPAHIHNYITKTAEYYQCTVQIMFDKGIYVKVLDQSDPIRRRSTPPAVAQHVAPKSERPQ